MTEPICSFPDCGAKPLGLGLCSGHYQQQHKGRELIPIRRGLSPQQRFWEKVRIGSGDECWQWTGAVGGHTYGNFGFNGETYRAHTWSYETLIGAVPDGLHIDHLCRNHLCVNPTHMEAVTCAENVRRGVSPLISRWSKVDQTHCKHDHLLSGENLYVQPKTGYRYCRTCSRARTQAWEAKQRFRKSVKAAGSNTSKEK